ncbi:hypothetical protein SCUCBS95973_000813 [Sporothrix curviconia]|uniref:Uncharacterized protein n=1 Tax=Sporothrix curviconia TaxID=1260050 RepID=A0ABP0ATD6_9PEZI
MDTSRARGASPAHSSRLPTKKNSFHSLRDAKENLDRRPPPPPSPALATSPSAISDTSSGTGTDNGFAGGAGGHFGFDSRRSSTSSQQSDIVRGRTSTGSLGQSRIPRPSPSQRPPSRQSLPHTTQQGPQPTPRRPLSIKDAYRMAEEEEAAAVAKAAQGSPSPAPRPWRSRAGGSGPGTTPTPGAGVSGRATPASTSESRMQKILAQSPLDIGGRRTARRIGELMFGRDSPSRVQRRSIGGAGDDDVRSIASNSSTTGHSDRGDNKNNNNNTDLRRIRYEEDQARMQVAMGEKPGGLFSPKARVSPKIAVAGRELHRRASNTSLSDKSKVPVSVTSARTATGSQSSLGIRAGKPGSYLKRMVSAPENVAQQASEDSAAELGSSSVGSPPPAVPLATRSATVPTLVATQMADALLSESPGNSFAWDADEDFTASDLMASESPRIELRRGSPPKSPSKSPASRPRNTKLDEIRQLELDADLIFPDEPSNEGRHADPDEILPGPVEVDTNKDGNGFGEKTAKVEKTEEDAQPLRRRPGLPAERTNKTLDEIRAREDAPLPKRAMAAMRLEEIRQQNAESRAKTPDPARKLSHEHLRAERARHGKTEGDEEPDKENKESKEDAAARAARDRALFGDESEQIPNTPITIFRTSSTERGRKLLSTEDGGGSDNDTAKNTSVSPAASRKSSSSTHSRNESQELLRKLARVTTSVVAAAERKDKPMRPSASPHRLAEKFSGENLRGGSGSGTTTGADFAMEKSSGVRFPRARDSDTLRPTVGFAQLRRQSSSESASTKRSSMAQSDGDPTDRIEAEMKLFAAGENHSERGSIRAPSPDEDLDDVGHSGNGNGNGNGNGSGSGNSSSSGAKSSSLADEATPRPTKIINPLMQPTPRVTGAYVETPVTERTEKMLEAINAEPSMNAEAAAAATATTIPVPAIIPLLRGTTAATDPGPAIAVARAVAAAAKLTENGSSGGNGHASSSSSRQKSRSRSRPRSRSGSQGRAPLINSAKPASARDDLLAIQRDQQIDDSTVDDFDELLATHTAAAEAAESAEAAQADMNRNATGNGTTDAERMRRMSQSIATYLHDVQSVKKGIERLEDQVSHPEKSAAALVELEKAMAEEEKAEKAPKVAKATTTQKDMGSIKSLKKEASIDDDLGLKNIAPIATAKQTKPQHQRQTSSVSSTTRTKDVLRSEKDTAAAASSSSKPLVDTPTVSYVQIPLPRLYRASPNVKLTFLGVLVLLLSIWFAAESTACAIFCRPVACQSGQACQWSPDDPSFGAAIPIKLDQWLTGGRGRMLATWAGEEVGDWMADAWDAATGTDIRQVDSTYFSFEEKRRHRRRLQKHGLLQPWTPSAEARPKLEAWRRAREARDQERRAREELAYGYAGASGASSSRYYLTAEDEYDDGVDEDGFEDIVRPSSDRMTADEKVGGWWWSQGNKQ